MKTLLRSCFILAPTDDKELFFRNALRMRESGLGFDVPEDTIIWTFVEDFLRTHNHVPDFETIDSHFKRKNEDKVTNRLQGMVGIPCKTQGDFEHHLNEKMEDRRFRQWSEVLKEAHVIQTTGMEVVDGKGKSQIKTFLKGPVASAKYITDKTHAILAPTFASHLSGEVTGDGESVIEEYTRRELDPLAGIGQYTGIRQIDEAMHGAKRYELWIHAAFTSHMKSTFMLNWVYNQAVGYKHDSLVFSLEMPYQQCRLKLYAIHSCHKKFRGIRHQLGIQHHPDDDVGLEYTRIRDAQLLKNEKEFFFKHVIPDFDNPANNYGKIHIEVVDPDKTDFTIIDLRQKAELLYAKSPYSSIYVDHAGLMKSRSRFTNTTEATNEVIRDLKRLAMSFNRGQGIAVIVLFQINREGFRTAVKRKEKTGRAEFDLTMLSYANEAEKSADIITTTWKDEELSARNRVQFQCLKSRDQAPFSPFVVRIEWPCGRMLTCEDIPTIGYTGSDTKADVDKLAEKLL